MFVRSTTHRLLTLVTAIALTALACPVITVENTIYFKKVKGCDSTYDPSTAEGIAAIAHEVTHSDQFRRYGPEGFAVIYFGGIGIRSLFMNGDRAYRGHSFEREAYDMEARIKAMLRKGSQ